MRILRIRHGFQADHSAGRGAGVFARLRDTARQLRAAGLRLGVNLLLTPDHVGRLRHTLDALLDLGVRQITFLRPKGTWAATHGPGFPTATDVIALVAEVRAFIATKPTPRLYVDTALRGEWVEAGLLKDPEPEVLGCGGGQRHVAVTPEGDVYPCSHARYSEYYLGNLLKDDLADLWCPGAGRQRYAADCQGVRCPCQVEAALPRLQPRVTSRR